MTSELANTEAVVRTAMNTQFDFLLPLTRAFIQNAHIESRMPIRPLDYLTKIGNGGERMDQFEDRTAVIIALMDEMLLRLYSLSGQILYSETKIDQINTKADELKEGVNEIKQEINGLKSGIDRLANDLIDLKEALSLIDSKLDGLAENINSSRTSILDEIVRQCTNLQNNLDRLNDFVTHSFSSLRRHIDNESERLRLRIFQKIDDTYEDIITLLNQNEDNIVNRLGNFIRAFFDEGSIYWNHLSNILDTQLQRFSEQIRTSIVGTNQEATLTYIDTRIGIVLDGLLTIETEVGGVAAEIAKVGGAVEGVAAGIAGIEVTIGLVDLDVKSIKTILYPISDGVNFIQKVFTPFRPSFYEYLEEKLNCGIDDIEKAIDKYIDEHRDKLKQLIKDGSQEASPFISDLVSNKIVGESYSRWNSTVSFFPTIVFIMKEDTDELNCRRAQIKLRYYKRSEEITEQDIMDLKEKAKELGNFSYKYGILRVNFVSKNKQTKTTIYAFDKQEALRVLTCLCAFVGVSWDENDLTYTLGNRRDSITRRSSSLDNIEPKTDNYNAVFKLTIFKVSLLVNGLERQIILYQA
jgi:uncharacterized protein YoxC